MVFPRLKSRRFVHWEGDETYVKLRELFLDDIPSDNPIHSLPQSNVLVSREGFLGSPSPLGLCRYGETGNRDIFIANVGKLLKDQGKLLVVIRRQDTLINSWVRYKPWQYLTMDNLFIDFPVEVTAETNLFNMTSRTGLYYSSYLDYFMIFKRILAQVDKSRVHILVFEDIANNRTKFYNELSEALDEDVTAIGHEKLQKVNASHPEKRLDAKYLGIYNKYRNFWSNRLPFLKNCAKRLVVHETKELNTEEKERVLAMYADGNRHLDEALGLGLKQYGYY